MLKSCKNLNNYIIVLMMGGIGKINNKIRFTFLLIYTILADMV